MARLLTRRRAVLLFIVVAAIAVAMVLTLPIALTPGLRGRLTQALGERFESKVDLASLRVSILPRPRVSGSGVVLRHKGRTDVPPLITVESFSAEARLSGLIGWPVRLTSVRVQGLEINIPPGGIRIDDADVPDAPGTLQQAQPQQQPVEGTPPTRLIIDSLLAERAVLRIIRRDPAKPPRVWEIARLSMKRAGSNEPWPFHAQLTNPIPPGQLHVDGTFGPWNAAEPSDTPLGAAYEFTEADLDYFRGIRGVLRSTGEFKGVIKSIEVTGTADVPDFALDGIGQPVPLTTQFTAVVDATNGNTWLRPVDARLGNSPLVARGGIVEHEGQNGRTIELEVEMTDARVEDVLRLAVKGPPALVGGLRLRSQFVLPPGNAPVIDKLQLDGTFRIASAQFSQGGLQKKINSLSQKARGEANSGKPPDRVASDFNGRYVMKNGVIRFSQLSFAVPGAKLNLAGRYAIRRETMDFSGTVSMDAKLSQLTTGIKSFLLKAVDPLMRRKGATVIPITVRGTAEQPKFGVDVKRALRRR